MLRHPNLILPTTDCLVEADVCVIGSGAGGAAFASELAEGGMRVVLLEKGGAYDHADFDQHEKNMMPLLYEDGGARTTLDGGLTVLHASCVGGTTTVNNAICFDPPERLLKSWQAEHGIEGLGLQDLASALAKVKFILNVQLIQETELNQNAQILRRGSRKLGWSGAPFQHNRTACLQSGFCMLGCSYDRKQSALVTYVPRALHFGAKLYPFAEVTTLRTEKRRITEVEARVRPPGSFQDRHLRVRARYVALAGGAINTPCLLLRNGIANSSGQVGNNLSLHPLAVAFANFEEDVRAYRGIPQGYYVDEFESDRAGNGGFLLESIFTHPGIVAATIPMIGPEHAHLMTRLNHLAAAYVQVHDRSCGEVRIGKDGYPKIQYALHQEDVRKIQQGWQALVRIFLAAGAKEVYLPHVDQTAPLTRENQLDEIMNLDFAPNKLALFSAHQMGSCRMGADPTRSVVDSRCKSHDLDNLYIADGSVFPSSSGVNPQITIMTIATHAAQQLLKTSKIS